MWEKKKSESQLERCCSPYLLLLSGSAMSRKRSGVGTSGAYESERCGRYVKEFEAWRQSSSSPPPASSREKVRLRRPSHFRFLLFRRPPEKRRILERSDDFGPNPHRLKASRFQRFRAFLPSWYVVAPISSSFFSSFGSCFVFELCCSSSSCSSSSSSSVWFIHWHGRGCDLLNFI